MHVNYNGMKKWLSSCGLSVGSLKSRAGGFHAEVREETGDRTFLPVIPSQPDKPASSPSDFLSGVTLTFHDVPSPTRRLPVAFHRWPPLPKRDLCNDE
jgi:hypothetical protein